MRVRMETNGYAINAIGLIASQTRYQKSIDTSVASVSVHPTECITIKIRRFYVLPMHQRSRSE